MEFRDCLAQKTNIYNSRTAGRVLAYPALPKNSLERKKYMAFWKHTGFIFCTVANRSVCSGLYTTEFYTITARSGTRGCLCGHEKWKYFVGKACIHCTSRTQ